MRNEMQAALPDATEKPKRRGSYIVLRLTAWAGLKLGADDIVNLRLALMALLPNVAGLLFAFAIALCQPTWPRGQ